MNTTTALLAVNLLQETTPVDHDRAWRRYAEKALDAARRMGWRVIHAARVGSPSKGPFSALSSIRPLITETVCHHRCTSPLDDKAVRSALADARLVYIVGALDARAVLAIGLTAEEQRQHIVYISEACCDHAAAAIGEAPFVSTTSLKRVANSAQDNVIQLSEWLRTGDSR